MPGKKAVRKKTTALLPIESLRQIILLMRGQRVIMDADLARLYGVTTERLKQQVRRNIDRFPEDFMFQLTWDEANASRMQFAALSPEIADPNSSLQFAGLNLSASNAAPKPHKAIQKHGANLKYRPFAFTEHGAIMAATVLNSPKAVKASLFVVRAFVQLRELLSTHRDLAEKLNELERKLQDHDGQILGIIDAIRDLMTEPDDPPKPPIGFNTELAPRIASVSRKKG